MTGFVRREVLGLTPAPRHIGRLGAVALAAALATTPAAAHEAWLLTPAEIEALARMPMPALFASSGSLALASLVGGAMALAALWAEDRLRPVERRLTAPLVALAPKLGPIAIRLGLAVMLALAAVGGLPRAGTAPWTQPTLFVPDMQLALVAGWDWLAPAQIMLACFLAAGLFTRAAGLAVVALALVGIAAFGTPFLGYGPHFAAPGLMLAILGGGGLSLDRALGTQGWLRPSPRLASAGWTLALVLIGGGFVYLGVTVKLTQPTLLMAILTHGEVPLFGLPLDGVALVMTGIEIIAGAMLALGRLTRPVALMLIGGFTFFAVVLGETPLFHANLYGVMAMLVLAGPALPDAAPLGASSRAVAA